MEKNFGRKSVESYTNLLLSVYKLTCREGSAIDAMTAMNASAEAAQAAKNAQLTLRLASMIVTVRHMEAIARNTTEEATKKVGLLFRVLIYDFVLIF